MQQETILYKNNHQHSVSVGDIVLWYSKDKPYAIPATIINLNHDITERPTIMAQSLEQLVAFTSNNSPYDVLVLGTADDKTILLERRKLIDGIDQLELVSPFMRVSDTHFEMQCYQYLVDRVQVDSEAAYQLGLWAFTGFVGLRDQGLAKQYWEIADQAGHAGAKLYLAEMFYAESDDILSKTKYLDLLKESAQLGHPMAQYSLGYYYQDTMPTNFEQAVYWYQKAADQNLAIAQCNLADKYEHGLGVVQDYSKAIELYLQAVNQKVPQAMFSLANMILNEKGLPNDISIAKGYLENAVKLNYAPAQELLNQLNE